MEYEPVMLRGLTLNVYYMKNLGWMIKEEYLEIHNILLEGIEMYDFCEHYNILPDIYEQLWKKI